MLRENQIQSYRGMVFKDPTGNTVGHIFAMDDRPHEDREEDRALFSLISQRVGAEYHRQSTELALRASEKRNQSLFQGSNDGILLLDSSGSIVDNNTNAASQLGYLAHTLKGVHLSQILDDDSGVEAFLDSLLANSAQSREVDLRCRRGKILQASLSANWIEVRGEELCQLVVRDIGSTKRSEAEAHTFRRVVDLSTDFVSMVDTTYTYRLANRRFVESLALPSTEVLGRTAAELHGAEEFATHMRPNLERSFRGETVEYRYWLQSRAGGRCYLDARFVPYRQEDGAITGAVISTRDITPLKLAEDALRHYERMASGTSDMMVFIDHQFVYQAVNQSYLDAFQKRRDEVVGHPMRDVVGEAFFTENLEPRLLRCMAGHETSWRMWLNLPAGGQRCVEVRFAPISETEEGLAGVVGTIRDINDQHQNQTAVVQLSTLEAVAEGRVEEGIKSVTEAAAETLSVRRAGVWLFDSSQTKLLSEDLYVNSRREHLAGPTFDAAQYGGFLAAVRNHRTMELHDALGDPRCTELDGYLRREGIVSMLCATIRHASEVIGMLSLEHVGAIRTWQAAEVIFAGEAADLISQTMMNRDRKALEARLQQKQKMEGLGVLAGGIAHDFNNLLVGVLGGADMALMEVSPGSPIRKHLEKISRSAVRASELCSQLLAYAGKGHLMLQAASISDVVRETGDLLESSLNARAKLVYALAEELPPVEVDLTQIRQVVMNLITNAAEALGEQGGSIVLRTSLVSPDQQRFGGQEPQVLFEVEDNGCGMDEDTQSKIFDPFFTTKFTGRGLGLAAVQGIVHGHGGQIEIRSRKGKGTSIQVLLPISDKKEIEGVEQPSETLETLPRRQASILIVDDEEMVRTVAREILKANGYDVFTAKDGHEGIDLFNRQRNEIDLIILDITMPQLSGEETLQALKEIDTEARVVLSSGYSAEDANTRFEGLGLAGFLQKPYRADTLLAKVRSSLDSNAGAGVPTGSTTEDRLPAN